MPPFIATQLNGTSYTTKTLPYSMILLLLAYCLVFGLTFGLVCTVCEGELRKILDRIAACSVEAKRPSLMEPLQEIVTYVQFANDECDYGMGLELGLDLFMHGDQFHSLVLNLLPLAYELLYRDEYARIIKEHVHHRDRTPLNICVTFKTV